MFLVQSIFRKKGIYWLGLTLMPQKQSKNLRRSFKTSKQLDNESAAPKLGHWEREELQGSCPGQLYDQHHYLHLLQQTQTSLSFDHLNDTVGIYPRAHLNVKHHYEPRFDAREQHALFWSYSAHFTLHFRITNYNGPFCIATDNAVGTKLQAICDKTELQTSNIYIQQLLRIKLFQIVRRDTIGRPDITINVCKSDESTFETTRLPDLLHSISIEQNHTPGKLISFTGYSFITAKSVEAAASFYNTAETYCQSS